MSSGADEDDPRFGVEVDDGSIEEDGSVNRVEMGGSEGGDIIRPGSRPPARDVSVGCDGNSPSPKSCDGDCEA
jgi:hypothetical protein